MIITMKKIVISFLFWCIVVPTKAQIIEINIEEGIKIDSINDTFSAFDLPFFLTDIDSIGQQWIIYCDTMHHDSIQLFRSFDNLEYIAKFQNKDLTFYLFLYYSYAGYDYFFLWSEVNNILYISNRFNFEQNDGYDFLFDSFDLDDFLISARQRLYSDMWTIHFKPFKNN